MKILTTLSRGAGAILPILLVVSVGMELYDRYQQRQLATAAPEEPEQNTDE